MRTVCSVQPWLVAQAVWEPAVGAADGHVENEVERYCEGASSATGRRVIRWLERTLVERSRVATAYPRVGDDDLLRSVRHCSWELATLEEGNVE